MLTFRKCLIHPARFPLILRLTKRRNPRLLHHLFHHTLIFCQSLIIKYRVFLLQFSINNTIIILKHLHLGFQIYVRTVHIVRSTVYWVYIQLYHLLEQAASSSDWLGLGCGLLLGLWGRVLGGLGEGLFKGGFLGVRMQLGLFLFFLGFLLLGNLLLC